MSILQHDPELRPLIFEHEILLKCLTAMNELRAENMLSILTAAETEMYENTRIKEEQGDLSERRRLTSERDQLQSYLQQSNQEIDRLQKLLEVIQEENAELKGNLHSERTKFESLEKEKECTFKNLFDEISQLKRQNELLKKSDHDIKRSLDVKDREYSDDLENLKRRLKQQEDNRAHITNEKERLIIQLRDLEERY